MTNYYIHNGTTQQGPFDINQLKALNIQKSTPVWYEGLAEWTTAGKVESLNDLFKTVPPPFPDAGRTAPPVQRAAEYQAPAPVKKKGNTVAVILIIIGVAFLLGIIAINNNNNSSDRSSLAGFKTYEQRVQTVEEIERENPARFLDASGTYNQNIWGTAMKVHGTIRNKATVVNYKDVMIEITFYTGTETVLTKKEYKIYDYFPAHETKSFELKIEKPAACQKLGWRAVSAVVY